MKTKIINFIFIILFFLSLTNCTKVGRFGAGVDITFDPRTIGMQIDDSIMQKNLKARLSLHNKTYFLGIQVEVIDGRIFLSGKVNDPEEKLKITKMAWETNGARSVKNAVTIKGKSNFKSTAKDVLITSQLRSALIFNKKTKAIQTKKISNLEEEKNQFQKGDAVTINHHNYDPTIIYEVVRVNKKSLTISNNSFGTLKASPRLLKLATVGSFPKLK